MAGGVDPGQAFDDPTRTVLGIDAGGTATRAVLCGLDGRVLGRGRAGPGNPVARGAEATCATLAQAVRAALADAATRAAEMAGDPGRVVAAVAGFAGRGALDDPATSARYDECWRALGITCPLRSVSDAAIAFAAGTPEPAGTVLIAGTGAVAARIVDREIAQVADGLGWLLGDEGSGFWLGRAAVRSTVHSLRADRPDGALTRLVHEKLLGAPARPTTRQARDADIQAVILAGHQARLGLSTLAPLVSVAHAQGDPAATAIVRDAADRLFTTLASIDLGDRPIVLAGGVLCPMSPVTEHLQQRLATTIGREATLSGDPAIAAAWLAMVQAARPDQAVAALHSRFLSAAGSG